ncbi:hypothetical protein RRG08_005184 [Elysia crispata]|uniref:Uncharacterized protein n=1 Tax=Elysia crispata TaxID=231223 RepID=A0AAE0ZH63_9GAST|nr:hypothetical protein RRG08_005184 [Elysia crispata]
MNLRAETSVFWPGITPDISDTRTNCNRIAPSNPSTPPTPLSTPEVGDYVRIQNQIGSYPLKWDKTGRVIEVRQFDQYAVKVDGSGRVTLRNRKFLRKYSPVILPPPTRTITMDIPLPIMPTQSSTHSLTTPPPASHGSSGNATSPPIHTNPFQTPIHALNNQPHKDAMSPAPTTSGPSSKADVCPGVQATPTRATQIPSGPADSVVIPQQHVRPEDRMSPIPLPHRVPSQSVPPRHRDAPPDLSAHPNGSMTILPLNNTDSSTSIHSFSVFFFFNTCIGKKTWGDITPKLLIQNGCPNLMSSWL